MNGVCVVWKGWLDLQRLDGAGYLEFDEDKAKVSHRGQYINSPYWLLYWSKYSLLYLLNC